MDVSTVETMSDHTEEKLAALQGIVERVSSYQEAAPEGTIERELRAAIDGTDLEVPDAEVVAIAEAIEARDKSTDTVEVREILG